MDLFIICRTPPGRIQDREWCTGSSPLNGRPYWGNPRTAQDSQPLVLRSRDYAEWCKGLCERKDETPEGAQFVYTVHTLNAPFFLSQAEVDGGKYDATNERHRQQALSSKPSLAPIADAIAGGTPADEAWGVVNITKERADRSTMEVVQFLNDDGSPSHWSVVHTQADGQHELATTLMHSTRDEALAEMRELQDKPSPAPREPVPLQARPIQSRATERPTIGITPVRCAEPGRSGEFFVWDGEPKRMPNKGDYFISGAIPEAYLAPHNLNTPYFICVPVDPRT